MIKKLLSCLLFVLFLSIGINARAKYSDYAKKGGKDVKTSTTVSYKLMETYPSCTITVYLTGTTTLASIYSNNSGTLKANPFTADSNAYYEFYADNGVYDVKLSGTGITSPFTKAVTLIDATTVGQVITLKTNNSNNNSQTVLNLKSGGTVTVTDNGSGNVTISGISVNLKVNGVNNGSQAILNLKAGSHISLTDDGVGGITIDTILVTSPTVVGDGIVSNTGNTINGNTTFNDSSATFPVSIVGKTIIIESLTMPRSVAGLITTVAARNSLTQIVLTNPAPATWNNTRYIYGTDKTAELNAAIAASQDSKINIFGKLIISSSLNIDKLVSLDGQGGAYPKYFLVAPTEAGSDTYDFSQSYGNKLIWAGGASNFFNITNTGGLELHNLIIDGSGITPIGLNLDRVRFLTLSNVGIMRATTALYVGSTASLNDGTFKLNSINLFVQGTNGIVFNSSGGGTTGGFVSSLHNTQIEYTNIGIDFQKGDNIVFSGLTFSFNHQYPVVGTNKGVNFGTGPYGSTHNTALSPNPYSCYNEYFQHLMTQGLYIADGNREAGNIENLDEANGAVEFHYGINFAGINYKSSGLLGSPSKPVMQWLGGIIYRDGGLSEPPFYIAPAGTLDPTKGPNQTMNGDRTLPLAASVPGFVFNLVNTNVGLSVLNKSGSDNISEQASYVGLTAKWKCVTVKSDGISTWVITGTCN